MCFADQPQFGRTASGTLRPVIVQGTDLQDGKIVG